MFLYYTNHMYPGLSNFSNFILLYIILIVFFYYHLFPLYPLLPPHHPLPLPLNHHIVVYVHEIFLVFFLFCSISPPIPLPQSCQPVLYGPSNFSQVIMGHPISKHNIISVGKYVPFSPKLYY